MPLLISVGAECGDNYPSAIDRLFFSAAWWVDCNSSPHPAHAQISSHLVYGHTRRFAWLVGGHCVGRAARSTDRSHTSPQPCKCWRDGQHWSSQASKARDKAARRRRGLWICNEGTCIPRRCAAGSCDPYARPRIDTRASDASPRTTTRTTNNRILAFRYSDELHCGKFEQRLAGT
jgi:hypothetical protein